MYNGTVEKHILNDRHELFCLKGTLDAEAGNTKNYLKILSPFDNVVIHREKLKDVFEFDYKIECYTPKEKRVFGYFSLPILFNDAFVARVDCKAHRKEEVLEIIHLHFEEGILDIAAFASLFAEEVKRYALFNGCHEIILKNVSPNKYFDCIKNDYILICQ